MSEPNSRNPNDLSPEEIAEQASRPDVDQIQRQIRRGNESNGEADERDPGGTVDSHDTPHGREERKHQVEEEAEDND